MKRLIVVIITSIIIITTASCNKKLEPEDCLGTYEAIARIDEHRFEKETIKVSMDDDSLYLDLNYVKADGDFIQPFIDKVQLDRDIDLSKPIFIETGGDYLFEHEFVFKKDKLLWRFVLSKIPYEDPFEKEELNSREYYELKKVN